MSSLIQPKVGLFDEARMGESRKQTFVEPILNLQTSTTTNQAQKPHDAHLPATGSLARLQLPASLTGLGECLGFDFGCWSIALEALAHEQGSCVRSRGNPLPLARLILPRARSDPLLRVLTALCLNNATEPTQLL